MTNSAAMRVSIAGSVFGMHATDVTPPATAAAVPVAIVSSSSRPGSRRWTCMSIRPGETISPVQSRVRSARARLRADAEDRAVGEPQVGDGVEVLRRVDDPAVAKEKGAHEGGYSESRDRRR